MTDRKKQTDGQERGKARKKDMDRHEREKGEGGKEGEGGNEGKREGGKVSE